MFCKNCGVDIGDAYKCLKCGFIEEKGDATSGIIPYKNVPALVAYYLGIFSLIPFIGILLGIPAVILGIAGLRKKAKKPVIKGTVHAWVGIILGGIFSLLWLSLILIPVVMNAFNR